jgi:hypothetical protein
MLVVFLSKPNPAPKTSFIFFFFPLRDPAGRVLGGGEGGGCIAIVAGVLRRGGRGRGCRGARPREAVVKRV